MTRIKGKTKTKYNTTPLRKKKYNTTQMQPGSFFHRLSEQANNSTAGRRTAARRYTYIRTTLPGRLPLLIHTVYQHAHFGSENIGHEPMRARPAAGHRPDHCGGALT
jgi:hypothetical protein